MNIKAICPAIAVYALLAATSSVAKADIVLIGATVADSFIDLGGAGFGNAPRMLTLQTSPYESGFETPVDVEHGDAIDGANKSTTPTLAALGWTTGANVGIGFNSGQVQHTGLTMQDLSLTLYNGTTAVGTFSLANPIQFSADDLALQTGNGNAVFAFGLDTNQQGTFNGLVGTYGSGLYAGLGASLGCAGTASATCQPANDGPDSFLGFNAGSVSVPDGGLTLMFLGGAFLGLEALRRRAKV